MFEHYVFNTLRPRQHGHHFPDEILKCIFVNENAWISIKFSLNIVPDGPIDNILTLVQIMAWRRLGDKPLSEPMMVLLLTHIWVTRPQWVKAMAVRFPGNQWVVSSHLYHKKRSCLWLVFIGHFILNFEIWLKVSFNQKMCFQPFYWEFFLHLYLDVELNVFGHPAKKHAGDIDWYSPCSCPCQNGFVALIKCGILSNF